MVWDFVYSRRLLSNGTYRPIHNAVLGFEHCMVAKARRAPPRYLKQVKTDCLLTQDLPRGAWRGWTHCRPCATKTARHAAGAHAHHVRQFSGALQHTELHGLGHGGRLPAGGLRHDPERLRLEHRAHLRRGDATPSAAGTGWARPPTW